MDVTPLATRRLAMPPVGNRKVTQIDWGNRKLVCQRLVWCSSSWHSSDSRWYYISICIDIHMHIYLYIVCISLLHDTYIYINYTYMHVYIYIVTLLCIYIYQCLKLVQVQWIQSVNMSFSELTEPCRRSLTKLVNRSPITFGFMIDL